MATREQIGLTSDTGTADSLTDNELKEILHTMMRIRRFEERAKEMFLKNKVRGSAHPCIGQEAVAAGACAALRPDDFMVSNHRGHGHCLAKGANLDRMMAELFGRKDGYCLGFGGSMHIADLERNILGANGIVGGGIGLGVGAALSASLRESGQAVLVFFGDGAANEGIFHEVINMAALWELPLVLLCENNKYGLTTSTKESTSGPSVASRAAGYDVPGVLVDGNDVNAVYSAVKTAAARARDGQGPTLIEASTYRWEDHSMRATLPRYRTDEEEAFWRAPERDPIARVEKTLLDKGHIRAEELERMREEIDREIAGAIDFAEASEEPSFEILLQSVYAPREAVPEPPPPTDEERKLTYIDALKEALTQEMERDPNVFVIGEDVGKTGGIFGVTRGLRDKFGPKRLLDTPLSEAGYAGAGVGAAIAGMRPVVEVQIFDFITLMMDMIVNQAAKFRFMLGGLPKVPVVFRGPQGGGVRLAAQHSQSLEAWFAHVPGLVVVAPSNPFDAKGLLIASIRDDNPVVFLEHKMLYLGQEQPVPEEPYVIPIGKAAVKKEGSDVTVVATMNMVDQALAAANLLEPKGISVEVIDPRTIQPLDEETIFASVRKTNRLVIVHEAWKRCGIGAEIAAVVAEKAFDYLDAPIMRVGAPDVPMPYTLEHMVIPSRDDIIKAIMSVCDGEN